MFRKSKKWFKDNLVEILPEVKGTYKKDVPMSKYTWFAVGGPAEVMFSPHDEKDLALFLKTKSYNLPICVVGGGSNLLVRDGGIPGVVIKLDSKYFRRIIVNEDKSITCFAGVKNVELKKVMRSRNAAGWNFCVPFPALSAGR